MEGTPEIDAIIEKLELTQEDLVLHKKAFQALSYHGNTRQLDLIPEYKREKIGKFYARLRALEIYDYNPETKKYRTRTTYGEAWLHTLRNDARRPEMEHVTHEELSEMLKSSWDDVKEAMSYLGSVQNIPEPRRKQRDYVGRMRVPMIPGGKK